MLALSATDFRVQTVEQLHRLGAFKVHDLAERDGAADERLDAMVRRLIQLRLEIDQLRR
jgi:hypothetical protein